MHRYGMPGGQFRRIEHLPPGKPGDPVEFVVTVGQEADVTRGRGPAGRAP